jgi:transposase InsO family protein
VIQQWIITVKDHSTGLTYITSLPSKKAKYVAHELDHIFGLIGYTAMLHTDNRKEFVAKLILKILKELNPYIVTDTGRPLTPCDQGSVESMNKFIKKVLLSMVSELTLKSIDPNWTNLLGRVMAVVNNPSGRGCYVETAFKAVFGQEYHQHIKCTVEEAHDCTTMDEWLGVSNDSRLEAVVQEYVL